MVYLFLYIFCCLNFDFDMNRLNLLLYEVCGMFIKNNVGLLLF